MYSFINISLLLLDRYNWEVFRLRQLTKTFTKLATVGLVITMPFFFKTCSTVNIPKKGEIIVLADDYRFDNTASYSDNVEGLVSEDVQAYGAWFSKNQVSELRHEGIDYILANSYGNSMGDMIVKAIEIGMPSDTSKAYAIYFTPLTKFIFYENGFMPQDANRLDKRFIQYDKHGILKDFRVHTLKQFISSEMPIDSLNAFSNRRGATFSEITNAYVLGLMPHIENWYDPSFSFTEVLNRFSAGKGPEKLPAISLEYVLNEN